jgi:molybdopterin-binding protein
MKSPFRSAVLLAGISLGVTLFAQGLNLRTGTWEFTMAMQGTVPMEGIPPEARAQIEAELRKPQIVTSCLTDEDVENLRLGRTGEESDDEECKVLTSKVTAMSADFTRQCEGDEPRTETVRFDIPTPQTMKGTIAQKRASGTMTIAMAGKWMAAQCKE